MGIIEKLASIAGRSLYQGTTPSNMSLDSSAVIAIRRATGGQLALPPPVQTRWYREQLERAEQKTASGSIRDAAVLMKAAGKDGVLAGVLATRTDGLVRLPKKFRGPQDMVESLEMGHESVRSVFDEMCPPPELALLASDGIQLGVGVAELMPIEGRDYPQLVRLDPSYLQFVWAENRWYYSSRAGRVPIEPGDGRWVLYMPGGRNNPWEHGLWRALGSAFIRKEHASYMKDNWEAKLANPARVGEAPLGVAEEAKQGFFSMIASWGVNSTFVMTPGYSVKLLESNGRGWESFDTTIARCDKEMVVAIAGQVVTTDGGAGFQNSDIHKSIRADLIKSTSDALAYCINTQVLPQWVMSRYGEDALDQCPSVEWDVTPPKDRNSEASSMQMAAQALDQLTTAFAVHGLVPDAQQFADRFGISVEPIHRETSPLGIDLVTDVDTAGGSAPSRVDPAQSATRDES
jgi:phage gp29-like protein